MSWVQWTVAGWLALGVVAKIMLHGKTPTVPYCAFRAFFATATKVLLLHLGGFWS